MNEIIISIMQWIGSIIGVVGFWFVASKHYKLRYYGFIMSIFSCAILIPWGIIVEVYGPIFIWISVFFASIKGAILNKKKGELS